MLMICRFKYLGHRLMSINSMSKPNKPRGRHGQDLRFLYQDEDYQGNISQILTGISDLKWQWTHCDGCSFNLFC